MKQLSLALLSLCAFAAQAELPPLIPCEILFGNPARTDPKVSPDGAQLSWLAPNKNNVLNVWTSALDGANLRCITDENGDPIEWYAWSGDGKQIQAVPLSLFLIPCE
jgi:hypothetical protein